MASIRTLEHEDLPAVTALLRENLPGWARGEDFLAATLLDHPWAREDPPSLVATADDGAVVGFLGAQSRPLLFDGRELRGVCASQLAVDPDHRGGAPGALLIRSLLGGDQDLTWVDSATDLVTRIWRAFGGAVDVARACDWMLVLRPTRWAATAIAGAARTGKVRRRVAPVASVPFHSAGRRLAGRAFPPLDPEVVGVPASAAEIVDQLPLLARQVRLRVDYGEADLEGQLDRIASVAGDVSCRLVHRDDRVIGWYAYVPHGRNASRVLHVAAVESHAEDVVGELTRQARREKIAVLAGRLEPHLLTPMRDRIAALGLGLQPLRHTRHPEVAAALATRLSLLTELDSVDSSWWYRAGPADD